MKTNPVCRKCGVELNNENWEPSRQKRNMHICKNCRNEENKQWQRANPEKAKAIWTRSNRKRGELPMSENKKCSAFLGVHVAERVLSHIFKYVVRMPYGNTGYDFICGQGYKIDVKSSCLHYQVKNGIEYPRWMFGIKRNHVADYFLCLAVDDRKNLNPLHVWLLLGEKVNHLAIASISPSTIHKWDAYRLDVTKVITCCNAMRTTHKASMENTERS